MRDGWKDYSCALQKDILVHGRLYVSQNYLCFYANIFRWETQVTIQWKDVTAITKEKTALVIPNAVLICTESEKHFLTSFTARDKTYLMLFRVWQNALLDRQMSMQEMWQWVHTCYGDELGLTSDDEDYIPPTADDDKPSLLSGRFSVDSFSEECFTMAEPPMEALEPEDGGPESPSGHGDSSVPGTPAPSLANGEHVDNHHPPPAVRAPSTEMLPTDMSDTTESDAEKGGVIFSAIPVALAFLIDIFILYSYAILFNLHVAFWSSSVVVTSSIGIQ
ncbi:GRAM domain-containing protein 1B [Gryllus bimaculatus]|nr:GRAM domain-containing protein 1B [Gryllus bimaculatus]